MTLFGWVIGFLIVQTVFALLFLIWSFFSGQMKDLEKQGRRVFFEDLEQDRAQSGPPELGSTQPETS